MTLQFGILFRLSVTHDFYDGGLDPAVLISPTSATQHVLRNYGMLAKMNRGKLEVGAEVESTDDGLALAARIREPMELMFTMQIKDPHWGNYTELLPNQGKVYYFSNRNTTTTENGVLLHPTPQASEGDQMVVTTSLRFSTEDTVTLLRKGIEDENRSTAIQTREQHKIVESRHLEEGLFESSVNGETQHTILSQTAPNQGIIQVLIDPNADAFAKVFDSNWILQSPDFKVHFSNRKSIWRYHFTQKNLEHLEGIQITNGGTDSPFASPEETTGPDGNTWMLIASNEPLAITSKPTQFLQLKKNMNIENRSEGVVVDRLPVPNKENLYRVGEDGTILTDLFINL